MLIIQTGCNPFKVFEPDSSKIQSQGWAAAGEQHEQAPADFLVCYHTLGIPQCQSFQSPNKHDEERQVGR